jgi:hypothetical protein
MHRTKIVFLAFALIMIFGVLSPAFAEVPVASPYTITTGRLG